ncbi:MAG: hypothetical protein ABF683_01625 [Sporolactobacillus sp.]
MRFKISGIFEREGFEIEVPVETIDASAGDEVNQYVRNANLGRVFFDPRRVRLCYLKRGGHMCELQSANCRCAVLRPPNEHDGYTGGRVYNEEDFRETSFSNFLALLSGKMPIDRNTYFEYIAYAFSSCGSVVQDAEKRKGGMCHAVY